MTTIDHKWKTEGYNHDKLQNPYSLDVVSDVYIFNTRVFMTSGLFCNLKTRHMYLRWSVY